MESPAQRWLEEQQSVWLYAQLVEIETNVRRRELFRGLGAATESQAALIAGDVKAAGLPLPTYRPSPRARLVVALARMLGTAAVRPMLPALKVRGVSAWDGATHVGGRGHGSSTGGTVRAAVFGINDGLISNVSLILAVAGSQADAHTIVLTGVAGLLAGAFSMASGEYVSMASQRELFEGQIAEERDELERYPDDEAEELALIYAARGVALEDARMLAKALVRNPERALDALAREELGVNPEDLGSPWGAAISSFFAFAVGAILPLVPFLLGVAQAVPVAVGISAVALFVVGATLSLYSGRSAWVGGGRMLLIGGLAGGATWLAGRAFGAVV